MPNKQLLQNALARLDNGNNWIKYVTVDNGRYCSYGAVAWEIIEGDYPGETVDGIVRELDRIVETHFIGRLGWIDYPWATSQFNDHKDTTFDDVRWVFEKAIEEA